MHGLSVPELRQSQDCRRPGISFGTSNGVTTAVKRIRIFHDKIFSFLRSEPASSRICCPKGFPRKAIPTSTRTYFEKIFGHDKERQRQYLTATLSEKKVTLSVGNRVLGALMATGRTRAVFTTNFDTVVERAIAEVASRSVSAYHLEGAQSASRALSNEEYPFYCKLHGDFRYDSIRNLRDDLAKLE